MLEPSRIEKTRARNGHYQDFDEMPRIVREWARKVGCVKLEKGVVGPTRPSRDVFVQIVRDSLRQQRR